jgi:hypothetical protein
MLIAGSAKVVKQNKDEKSMKTVFITCYSVYSVVNNWILFAQHDSKNSKLDFPLCLCTSVFKAVQEDSGNSNLRAANLAIHRAQKAQRRESLLCE